MTTTLQIGERVIFNWNAEKGQTHSDGEILQIAKNGKSIKIRGYRMRLGKIDPVTVREWVPVSWVQKFTREMRG